MANTVDAIYKDALSLSEDSRVILAERLIESVAPDPHILKEQMAAVRQRLEDLDSGKEMQVPGPEAIQLVRAAVKKQSQA